MKNLKLGDKVLVGSNKYETVYSFGHFAPEAHAFFVEITTEASFILQVSSQHLLFLEDGRTILASQVTVDDRLMGASDSPVRVSATTKLIKNSGVFAPFTKSGMLVVDGILASSYISLKANSTPLTILKGVIEIDFHWMAHASQFPHRVACVAAPGMCRTETYTADGMSTWVALPLQWSQWLLSRQFVIARLILTICVVIVSVMGVIECCILNPVSFLVFLYLAFQVANRLPKCWWSMSK